jgi:hypothetical protein
MMYRIFAKPAGTKKWVFIGETYDWPVITRIIHHYLKSGWVVKLVMA